MAAALDADMTGSWRLDDAPLGTLLGTTFRFAP